MNSSKYLSKAISIVLFMLVAFANVLAQMPKVSSAPQSKVVEEDNTWWYIILFILVLGLAGAVGWWYKTKQEKAAAKDSTVKKVVDADSDALDADKEMEWFNNLSKVSDKKKREAKAKKKKEAKQSNLTDLDKREQRRLAERRAFEKLPINGIESLIPAPIIEPLPLSNDEGLISAIEQAQDEYEEDEQIREVALRVLSKFSNRNAVEALSEIALYDLSSHLRSNAVLAVAEFDHESVFESVLLACADPTREVRAAAARALFRLSGDRAEAWTRIAECEDDYRIVQAAKAAVASELVDRSIDRLVHDDENHAYEAFALVALLVRAGETKEIFDVMENQRNKSVKLAILHCLKVLQDPNTLPDLYTYIERNSLPEDLSNAANEVIKSFDLVVA